MRQKQRRPLITAAFQTLEARQMLATPAGARPENLSFFDKGERYALIDRMDNLSSQSTLRSKIGSGTASQRRAFDDALLSHMRSRSNVKYHFDPDDAASNAAFIKNSLSYNRPIDAANLMVDSRLFPESPNNSTYNTAIGGQINFRAPNGSLGDPFALGVNRFEYWGNLAEASWLGGDQDKYVDEIEFQLATWSTQFDSSIDVPSNWNAIGKSGWELSTSIRADAWTQAYFKLLSPSNGSWNGVDNTLMLYKLMQHGDWLFNAAKSENIESSADSNKTITLAKSLFALGKMFPEFDAAAAWESRGRELLIESMNLQIYADGSHREQSPGYTLGVAEDLLDSYNLDKVNGDAGAWSTTSLNTLKKIIESYRQFLTPDGRRPGTGDTYRNLSVSLFLKAGTILDTINPTTTTVSGSVSTSASSFNVADAANISVGDVLTGAARSELIRVTGVSGNTLSVDRGVGGTSAQALSSGGTLHVLGDQPFAKPSIGDVWLLGQQATTPFLNVPTTPEGVLGRRGRAYAMPDSGNYILRSNDSSSATQLTFDAGPKGGSHGHHDLLNFELWSGDRPLIIDPGPYKYAASADRDYVLSTKAHNTINVDGQNHGWIEGQKQPAIIANFNPKSSFATMTGTHFGYSHLAGQPVITRSIFYDYAGTMVVVDFAESSTAHKYQQSFNVPGSVAANVAGASGGTEFRTRFADGDNVRVKTINGGDLVKGGLTFVTSQPEGDYKDDAYRYTVSKTDDFSVFVTLINTYTGTAVPNIDAQLITTNPQPGQPVQVKLTNNGSERTLTFQQPTMARPAGDLRVNALVNDAKHDRSGNLHVVYNDRNDGFLKHTVKDVRTGKWSVSQVVDNTVPNVAAQVDLEFDNDGRPAVAYYDQPNGDLKYAILSRQNNHWRTQTIDSSGTVGQNPSLTFSRKGNSALISYYNRSKRDLKLATQQTTTGWSTTTIDARGEVGRYSQIALDPNRTDLNSRWVIAYEDETNAQFKYAYTAGSLRLDSIKGRGMETSGGFMSLAFEDTGSGTVGTPESNRFQPRFSFYESWPDASLWLAKRSKEGVWSTQRVDGAGTGKKMGAYNQLSYASGKAEIFYYDDRNAQLRRAINTSGSTWAYSIVDSVGGRETRPSRYNGVWSVTSWDVRASELTLLRV